MVWTVYCRVHPLAVRTSFSLSVYARGLAYGVTRPLRPSRDVAATSHLTSSFSNGSSRRSNTSAISCVFVSMIHLLVRSLKRIACGGSVESADTGFGDAEAAPPQRDSTASGAAIE